MDGSQQMTADPEQVLDHAVEANRCRWAGDLKRRIWRSRCRVG